jgi:hypothetical protein
MCAASIWNRVVSYPVADTALMAKILSRAVTEKEIFVPGLAARPLLARTAIGAPVVKFHKRAHNPLRVAAGFDETEVQIPSLGKRRLRPVFGYPFVAYCTSVV